MADTFKIFGSNVPKSVAFGGGGLILVGGVYYYRKQKTSQANKASVTAAGTDSIDPATGYPYGSPEDAAALQTQGNYQSPIGGGYSGYSGGGSSSGSSPGSFTNNAQWAQFVEGYEINNMGADAPTVGDAIGKYLLGHSLITDAMISIVQSAIAIGGFPPVPGPNGNPPNYITSATTPPNPAPTPTPTPTPTSGPMQTSNVSIPNTKGNTAGTAHNKLVAVGLIPIADPEQRAFWIVAETVPAAGKVVPKGTRVLIVTTNETVR